MTISEQDNIKGRGNAGHFIGITVLFSFVLMFCTFGYVLFASLKEDNEAKRPVPPNMVSGGGNEKKGAMGMSMDAGMMENLGLLMAEYKANPNDAKVILKIAETFIEVKEWAQAEGFLNRAISIETDNLDAYYMLSIAQLNLGKKAETAKTLEKLLTLTEDPRAEYNLAIIYMHSMNRPEEGIALLNKIIASDKAEADLKAKATEELNHK